MKTLRTWLVAPLLGALLLGAAFVAGQTAPASATLPPGWTPGTRYQNIFNGGINTLPAVPGTNHPVFPAVQSVPYPVVTSSSFVSAPPAQGQYCSDPSGGQVFVPDGAPTDNLTCPAQSSS
jgi:hypothetical protein